MKTILIGLLIFWTAWATAGSFQYMYLGGVVDPSQAWSYTGDADWHEIGGTSWRICYTPVVPGQIEVRAMPHIRSGNGAGQSRLYNKLRLVRVTPTRHETLAINSESLWEGNFGYGDQVRFFDNSRTVLAIDATPVQNQSNCYAVEAVAGDGLHIEVLYGSPLMMTFHPD